MRVAHNDDELAQLILADMQKAVQATEKKAIAAMHKGISDFYAGSYPKKYERTYQLAETPNTTGVKILSKKSVQFDAFLDDSLPNYTTGKHPSMAAVLQLTDRGGYPGLRPAVGAPGYWEMITTTIEKDFDAEMSKQFG